MVFATFFKRPRKPVQPLATHTTLQYEESGKLARDNSQERALIPDRGALSTSERQNYTNAVLCLMSLPAKINPTLVPGAKTRYIVALLS